MKISIIHPTRGRKAAAISTVVHWLAYADNPFQIEYIISVDSNDTDVWMSTLRLFPHVDSNHTMDIKVIKKDNRSAVDAINKAAERCTGDLIIVVSDDFSCEEHWDTLLLKELEGKSDFLVKTQDGLQPTLITLPIMDKTYYNRFGYIYHPDYQHMFCDQEMTAVGHMLGKIITLYLTFEHLHYTTGKSPKDVINEKNDNTWVQGQNLFNDRLSFNFGIENPVISYSEIKWR